MLLLFEGTKVDNLCAWWEKNPVNQAAKSFLLHTIQIVTTPSLVATMLCVLAISTVQGYKRSPTQMPLTMQQPQLTDHPQRTVAVHLMAEGYVTIAGLSGEGTQAVPLTEDAKPLDLQPFQHSRELSVSSASGSPSLLFHRMQAQPRGFLHNSLRVLAVDLRRNLSLSRPTAPIPTTQQSAANVAALSSGQGRGQRQRSTLRLQPAQRLSDTGPPEQMKKWQASASEGQ